MATSSTTDTVRVSRPTSPCTVQIVGVIRAGDDVHGNSLLAAIGVDLVHLSDLIECTTECN